MTRPTTTLAVLALAAMAPLAAAAATPFTLQLGWRAQAEQGGYYTALVKGYYADCGVDMTIRQGGAEMDPARLLTSGAVDASLSAQNDAVMRMDQAGFPAVAVMTSFQKSPQSLDVHASSGITSLDQLKGHPVFIGMGNRTTIWPFLKMKYGLSDDQLRSFTGQFAPFLANADSVTQDYLTNGPYVMAQQSDIKLHSFLLADNGYQPYDSLVTVSREMIDKHPDVVACVVDASRKGWTEFFEDPKPAFAEIARVAPENTPGLLAYAFKTMVDNHLVETDETAENGINTMTDARWKAHFDMLVKTGTFPADFDYRQAYTLQFQ